jgi:aspartate carbamoyltransferase catalytic subunit
MSPLDFSVEELDQLLDLASDIEKHPKKYAHACDGKKLATCFYEPSTRTRLSFEAAMLNLGGSVLGFASADSSSASKGESISDTIRVISCYADICAMRHPKEGAALVASQKSRIPVINAGDGGHQHPTQTLTDLMTIRSLKGRLGNITIGLCGDLKFGRTVHSLINALIRYENVKFILISPEELKIPDYIREDVLQANHVEFEEVERLEDAMSQLDVLYMTRVQKERFFNEEDYIRLKDFYILTKEKMELAKDDSILGSLNTLLADPALAQSLHNVQTITSNLTTSTVELNTLMRTLNKNVPTMMAKANTVLDNTTTLTNNLAALDLASTKQQIDQTLSNVNDVTAKLNSKDGTVGLLLNDPGLYNRLNATVTHADSLMIDLRMHPKRYVHFSVFGRKDK